MNDRILEAIKKLKENQDDLSFDLKQLARDFEKSSSLNMQEAILKVADDLARYTIKDGKNGLPGRNGKDGKDGRDGRDGKDGVTPLIKIGKIEFSDTYGGGDVKMRFGKGNIIYLDFKLPMGRQGFAGLDGKDAKINGKNVINIIAGNNISVEQEDENLTIRNHIIHNIFWFSNRSTTYRITIKIHLN